MTELNSAPRIQAESSKHPLTIQHAAESKIFSALGWTRWSIWVIRWFEWVRQCLGRHWSMRSASRCRPFLLGPAATVSDGQLIA